MKYYQVSDNTKIYSTSWYDDMNVKVRITTCEYEKLPKYENFTAFTATVDDVMFLRLST